jgi:hypothetical protein
MDLRGSIVFIWGPSLSFWRRFLQTLFFAPNVCSERFENGILSFCYRLFCILPSMRKRTKSREVWRKSNIFPKAASGLLISDSRLWHSNSQFWTPYEAKRTICLLDMSTTPSGIRVWFAGEELCLHKTLKASRVQKPIFSSQTCIITGLAKEKPVCIASLWE